MTVRNLDALLSPLSVRAIDDPAAASGSSAPSLAVLRVPSDGWASLVTQLGAAGTRAIVLDAPAVSADGPAPAGGTCAAHLHNALAAARPFLLRLLGPGDAGVLTPRVGLHAGLADGCGDAQRISAPLGAGRIAWVTQSGHIARRALRFAAAHGLGVSSVVSLGQEADVDCGDMLDYLSSDRYTAAVIVAIDHVKAARKFMSAARACVRNKPVMIWCDPAEGEDALAYDAALERAAFVRLADVDALLEALATLQSPQVSKSSLMERYRTARERLAQTPPSLPWHDIELQRALALVNALAPAEPSGVGGVMHADDAGRLLGYFGMRCARPQTQTGSSDVYARAAAVTVTMRDDHTFGPFLVFSGPGGHASSALLPLNAALARDALMRLAPLAGWPAGDLAVFVEALASLSLLLCSVERIFAFSAQFLVADAQVVLDCIEIGCGAPGARRPLAIRPYPVDLQEHLEWEGRRLTIRPIRPEDEYAHAAFFGALTPEDVRLRFFDALRQPEHTQLARYVQIDYDREMALIACTEESDVTVIHGVARAVADPDNDTAEFALTVRSDEKGHHLGRLLLERIIDYCRGRGTRCLVGEVLRENVRMLALARDCGFVMQLSEDPAVISVRLLLRP